MNHLLPTLIIICLFCSFLESLFVDKCHHSLERKASFFNGVVPMPVDFGNTSALSARSSCFRSQPLSSEVSVAEGAKSEFCFPTVFVAGFPKCGTSFLFHVLSSHPHIISTRRKELCLGGPLSETWPKYISFLPTIQDVMGQREKLVLTGCLHLGANIKATRQICVTPHSLRIIYMVRNVADMLWAAYNYWCNVETDGPSCFPGKHTEPGHDIRSPSLFHERITRNLPMGGGYPITPNGVCFRKDLLRASRAFGPANILVIKSEELLDASLKPRVLNGVLRFLQLDNDNFGKTSDYWVNGVSANHYIVNSGAMKSTKGAHKIVTIERNSSKIDKGKYEVSGYVPMLAETRELIYKQWKKECRFLKNKYGIHYEDAC